jgi:uncharacterized coiled-coil protein SlyX
LAAGSHLKFNNLKTMQKSKYFNTDKFVQEIMDAMNFKKLDKDTTTIIRRKILARLHERILSIIMQNFGRREIKLFNKLKADHPEIDELDVIMMMLPDIEGLQEKIIDGVNDLYTELTFYADTLQKEKNYLLSKIKRG